MSMLVVTAVHGLTREDYDEAASPEDIKALDGKISSIKKSLSDRVTETVFESEVASLKKKIEAAKESITNLRESIVHTLENGEWKNVFSGEIEAALRRLETRYDELNVAIDLKMQTLPRFDLIEENINAVFMQQSEKIKEIIIAEGENARLKIKQQQEQSDLFALLAKGTKEISWE